MQALVETQEVTEFQSNCTLKRAAPDTWEAWVAYKAQKHFLCCCEPVQPIGTPHINHFWLHVSGRVYPAQSWDHILNVLREKREMGFLFCYLSGMNTKKLISQGKKHLLGKRAFSLYQSLFFRAVLKFAVSM